MLPYILGTLFLVSASGCDKGASVIKLGKCAASDKTLAVGIKDPKKAWKDLGALIEANEKGERYGDTLSLMKSLHKCLKPLAKDED